MVFYKDKEIYIEKRDYITRQVFSVAHELGHYCLHNDGTEHSTKRDALSGMGIDEKEKEANHFAACLLMPKNELIHFVSMGINLDALASYFNVSPITMSFRLENLGIKVSI